MVLAVVLAIGAESAKGPVQPGQPAVHTTTMVTIVFQTASTAQAPVLKALQDALTPHLDDWKAVNDYQTHLIPAGELGLAQSLDISEIAYGRCDRGGYYVIARENHTQNTINALAVFDSYYYDVGTAMMGSFVGCVPEHWSVVRKTDLGKGWGFGTTDIIPAGTPTPGK